MMALVKAKAAADQKTITDEIQTYFKTNPNENVYVGVFGIGGNSKVCLASE